MDSRPVRTSEQFGNDLFPQESAQIAAKLREILARHLSIDLSRLSPNDTFADLEVAELDSMATTEFVIDLEHEFKIEISDSEAEKLRTFGDIVRFVSDATKQTKG
jgi:acyl carrier protein